MPFYFFILQKNFLFNLIKVTRIISVCNLYVTPSLYLCFRPSTVYFQGVIR
ncbi:hypothetical protein LEP1GSC172_3784 [Leptospira noguchii]|uniref:Uncharacterized protein n=1 Tax=Leptospira noguchii TaxID=28182 RepID=M6VB80_9LEPT|nr:hypothetical protein LEP1GSC172_3784 [Leptospira noguchii]